MEFVVRLPEVDDGGTLLLGLEEVFGVLPRSETGLGGIFKSQVIQTI